MNETISPPQAIALGARVRLKNGVFRDMKFRQWEFSGVEKGKIVLCREEGSILKVALEDIEWEHGNGPRLED